jgi:hypothetical protein
MAHINIKVARARSTSVHHGRVYPLSREEAFLTGTSWSDIILSYVFPGSVDTVVFLRALEVALSYFPSLCGSIQEAPHGWIAAFFGPRPALRLDNRYVLRGLQLLLNHLGLAGRAERAV